MKFPARRAWIALAASALAGLLAAPQAQAQDYPSRPIRIIVPFAAGGGGDAIGRLVARKLGDQFKQSVIVENKPGASSIIATDLVAKSPPDGYTILLNVPLIKDAEVRKLYPGHLSIGIVERQPFALWQKDGQIQIVSQDGMPIDTMHDDKYVRLPLIVGDGANARLGEYMNILTAAGDLASRIKSGALVAQRRWTIYTTEGVEIRLPERDPVAAIAQLVRMQRDHRVLDKDIVALDLRVPGRVEARLSDEAASARLEAIGRKPKGKV
mgnify:CR=1 FL=1